MLKDENDVVTKDDLQIWVGQERAVQIQAWAAALGLELEPERQLTIGRSGSVVALMTARSTGDGGDRRVVFKLSPGGAHADEVVRHREALESSSSFAAAHLVQLTAGTSLGTGEAVSLQEFAGGDSDKWQPLASLTGRVDMGESLAVITKSLLSDWNNGPRLRLEELPNLLGTRVTSRLTENGTLTEWIRSQFGSEVLEADWLIFPDTGRSRARINPVALVREVAGTGSNYTANVLTGNSHGDLHVENILLPVVQRPEPASFRLIDLASFAPDRSLTDDPANLLLSEVERIVVRLSDELRRGLLVWIDERPSSSLQVELAGIATAWIGVEESGRDYAEGRGYGKEWRSQFWLSLSASALVLASRSRLEESVRLWFFELASVAASKWAEMSGTQLPDGQPVLVGPDLDQSERDAQEAARYVASQCSNFDGSMVSVAVVPRGGLPVWPMINLAGVGWDMIVDFDPDTNEPKGCYEFSRKSGESVRLIIPTETPTWSRNATTWVAGMGLRPVGAAASPDLSLREWRKKYLGGLGEVFRSIASTYSGPIKIIVFGDADDFVRAVVEIAFDSSGARTSVLAVSKSVPTLLEPYDPELRAVDASLVAQSLRHRPEPPAREGAAASLPGGREAGGRILLDDDERRWLEDGFEVLHSGTGLNSDAVDGVGMDFYGGRRISWFELESDADLKRDPAVPPLERSLVQKLKKRSTDRHPYRHYPGAGGTTVARRVAWNLHLEHPVVVANRLTNSDSLAERVERLAILTDRKVLVVIEASSESITDHLYERLRSGSVAALLLLVSRSSQLDGTGNPDRELLPMQTDEVTDFRRFFGAMKPERRMALDRIGMPGRETAVPFMYALTAFQSDFVGLAQYVKDFLATLEPTLKPLLVVIAIAHRFAGTAVHASVFANYLRLPPDQPARLAKHFGGSLNGLLLEEKTGYWRAVHSLIAEQILRECLAPTEGVALGQPDAWRANISHWAETLIEFVEGSTTGELSLDSDELLQQLFIKRETRYDGDKARYSELIETIPSEARERVLRKLTDSFPEQAHYWAHFSRWQSAELRNHILARQSMDEALRLTDDDPIIWHMRGTNTRRELFDYLETHRRVEESSWTQVLKQVESLAREAIDDFGRASDLDDTSDYPLVSTAELCIRVIEWGKASTGADSYAHFLRRPSASFFSELLDIAEEAAAAVTELEGDDKASRAITIVRARLAGVYDDYSGMIQSWRNILDTATGPKTALRVRLARLYGFRNGGWASASSSDIKSAMALLNESLLDNPTDARTVRAWLSAARYVPASLSRAQEVVSYWVEHDRSRDALYFDYVLTALHALNGGLASAEELSRKVERMRNRSQDFQQRRTVFDWIGHADGLGQLINKAAVADWERSSADPGPATLRRLPGRVGHILNAKRGTILLENDVEAFFTPSAANLRAGQHEHVPVTALVGFSYDGIQAWSVEVENGESVG